MGLKEEHLQAARTPLVGFSSKPVYPKERISLKVQVGGASLLADFLVVDAPSLYNAIMGRTWLHSMEAVPFTRHQKLKFPLENENDKVEVITVKVETLEKPSIEFQPPRQVMCVDLGPSWIDSIIAYLRNDRLLEDKNEAYKIRLKAARFWLSPDDKLYKKSYTGPYLQCVHPSKFEDFLYEIHEGVCGSHIGGLSLAYRAISQGYWWPYMQKDAQLYDRKWEKCQKFSHSLHQPTQDLSLLSSSWPFAQWSLDIMEPLHRTPGNKRWLLYFTK
ncbi:hypothetical protein AAC387_Pa07g0034 [Persea americana]